MRLALAVLGRAKERGVADLLFDHSLRPLLRSQRDQLLDDPDDLLAIGLSIDDQRGFELRDVLRIEARKKDRSRMRQRRLNEHRHHLSFVARLADKFVDLGIQLIGEVLQRLLGHEPFRAVGALRVRSLPAVPGEQGDALLGHDISQLQLVR